MMMGGSTAGGSSSSQSSGTPSPLTVMLSGAAGSRCSSSAALSSSSLSSVWAEISYSPSGNRSKNSSGGTGDGLLANASTDLAQCVSSAALARQAQQGVGTCAGEPDLTGKLRRLRRVAGENPDSLTLDVAIGLPCLL